MTACANARPGVSTNKGRARDFTLENEKRIAQNMAVGVDDTRAKHQSLLKELQEERAAALARISRRLERLIGQLHATRQQIAHGSDEDRERSVTAYRELREQAVKYRWYLEVQREAIGLRQHQRLDEFYRIPPAEP
jgi:CRP-like cAMP-binding protein